MKSEFFTSQHKFPYLISRSIIYGHKSKRTPQEQCKEPKSGRSLRFIEFRVLHFFTFLLLCYWFHFIFILAREGASKSWWRKQKPSRYRELLGSLRCCISYLASQKWVLLCSYILLYKKFSSVLVISLRQMGLSTHIASECEMMIIPSLCEVKSKPKFTKEQVTRNISFWKPVPVAKYTVCCFVL